jgi:hypothetical protein
MERRIARITEMASEFYGAGELRITTHGHALWAADNGIEYPLGWSIFEAEKSPRRILAKKAERPSGAVAEREEEE